MGDINAKITGLQNSNDKKDADNPERKQCNPTDEVGKVDVKFCRCPVLLFILFMIIIIGGIIHSVDFIKNICEPFKNSSNLVACIQYTVSLALVLAAVIVTSISLIKAAKWLIKVDFIRQVLSSSCNAEQKKKFCDTLVEL